MSQFLLVHGASGGAWCWHKLMPELERRGHRALAIDLPGHGEDKTPLAKVNLAAYAERVADTLKKLPEPAVLIGHSMGGMVISAAAELAPEWVRTLVYLCAYLPRDGESLSAIEGRNPRPTMRTAFVPSADWLSATVPPEKARVLVYQDCSDADFAYATPRHTPQALKPFTEPVHLTQGRFGRIPRVYVECTKDGAISIELQRDMIAASPPVDRRSLAAGHAPFFSVTDKLADTLADL